MKTKVKISQKKEEFALQWVKICMELINHKNKQNINQYIYGKK